jgi:uncharacterized protein
MKPRVRRVAWRKEDPFGAEHAEVRFRSDSMQASGVAIGSAPMPYRLYYELETTARFVTARLEVTVRTLALRLVGPRQWGESVDDEGSPPPRQQTDLAGLDEALDVDLRLSPLFNRARSARCGRRP